MKSMTMIPPMSRSRSCLAIEVVLEDGLLKARHPDVLAGVDVDDGERFGPLDDERPAGRQPHLAVERFVQLLVNMLALEQRERLDLGVVELDALGERRLKLGDVCLHHAVEQRIVDEDRSVLLGQLLTDDPDGHVGL